MQKKHALMAILLLALVAFLSVGATLAYLTDTDSEDVIYAVGTVNVNLEEPGWKQPGDPHFNEEGATLFPGRRVTKDPIVLIDKDSEDCYVRLKVTVDNELARVIETPMKVNDGWKVTKVAADSQKITYYYTYQKVLKVSDEKTNPAFSSVKILANIPGEDHTEMLDAAGGKEIRITAEAIQAAGFSDVDKAFEAYSNFYNFDAGA